MSTVRNLTALDNFPMDTRTWKTVQGQLKLSPQQTLIVEGILRGQQDRAIASDLGLTVPTIRTYLTRIFDRTGATDRIHLVLMIFAMAMKSVRKN